MPVLNAGEREVYEMHGSRFDSYVAPSRGSRELCAWRTTIASGQAGTAHVVDHEEVFLVLEGAPVVALDGHSVAAEPGWVILVPAGSSVRLDNPHTEAAVIWVCTVVGLTATTAAGEAISPPWVQ
ncbi:MAG: cupin domain-containing protein [Actinomycetota bacterium]|nr:cupin domain-containing protein [Actinomycetota bacterium]